MPKKTAADSPAEELEKLKQLNTFLQRRSVALTPQELKVLYYALQRRTNADIATALEVSIATIKTHKNNLISKLGVEGKDGFQKFVLEMAHYPFRVEKNSP